MSDKLVEDYKRANTNDSILNSDDFPGGSCCSLFFLIRNRGLYGPPINSFRSCPLTNIY